MKAHEIMVGEDEFGIFVEVEQYDYFDEIEDVLIETYSLVPIATKLEIKGNGLGHRLWFSKSLSIGKLSEIVCEINKRYT